MNRLLTKRTGKRVLTYVPAKRSKTSFTVEFTLGLITLAAVLAIEVLLAIVLQ